ncbi:hypothetical protein LZZ90_13580 [Flavobacterium sp. SM15]|uniref:hypothetical protein n=1 Tax=Flavobacterium sp. SM15 TaxID=2908005 RepID=UPI001EDBC7F0|nr:hypothetical protein [Flavobacterium sp. SM15]MCG2612541.1 hypothetical protein [Flavobacterium sp. SM15]
MKNATFYIAVATLVTAMTSCKDEKKEFATTTVNEYVAYVDSLSETDSKEAIQNWEEIEATTNLKKNKAENAVAEVSDKTDYENKISATSTKYDEFRVSVETEKQKTEAVNPKKTLRKSLFRDVEIGDDMNFNWVNKDNIANVYDNFVTTVSNNKDSYSREDWDEIKLLYEALDAHKNTVEKNGLSGKDNTKISGLKIKFSTMYRLNRIGAKSEENATAKQ